MVFNMGIYDYCQVLGSRGRQLKIATNEIRKSSNPTIMVKRGNVKKYWSWHWTLASELISATSQPICYIFERWANPKPQRIAWQSFPCRVGFRIAEETRDQIVCGVWYVLKLNISPYSSDRQTIAIFIIYQHLSENNLQQSWIKLWPQQRLGTGTLHIFCNWAQFYVLWN